LAKVEEHLQHLDPLAQASLHTRKVEYSPVDGACFLQGSCFFEHDVQRISAQAAKPKGAFFGFVYKVLQNAAAPAAPSLILKN